MFVTTDGHNPDEATETDMAATQTDMVLDDLLDEIYAGQERVTQAEIHRRAVAAEVPADVLIRITAMPEGEYAVEEAADLLGTREAS